MNPPRNEIKAAIKWLYGSTDAQANAILESKPMSALIEIWKAWNENCKKAFYND